MYLIPFVFRQHLEMGLHHLLLNGYAFTTKGDSSRIGGIHFPRQEMAGENGGSDDARRPAVADAIDGFYATAAKRIRIRDELSVEFIDDSNHSSPNLALNYAIMFEPGSGSDTRWHFFSFQLGVGW